ncbi:hypothetical protein K437DRAFT_267563 [Tilletiaria anomala UBC 951]|uniref:Uncharacterized protein n=1 Tax=Tilletiaria anomala (strain ATCC 24038 / CBS 436.72 / UBC 951) TaxID=1037660 RepID=A0A066WCJ1_TILAU|nr:uncharacterized protein K437DRAFT_267563 [Tilletiaria anomala UBC 951]KDN48490.1 hypothetical protein K437DRAFT_267563 [Tilletiaria anomala UBC 951]
MSAAGLDSAAGYLQEPTAHGAVVPSPAPAQEKTHTVGYQSLPQGEETDPGGQPGGKHVIAGCKCHSTSSAKQMATMRSYLKPTRVPTLTSSTLVSLLALFWKHNSFPLNLALLVLLGLLESLSLTSHVRHPDLTKLGSGLLVLGGAGSEKRSSTQDPPTSSPQPVARPSCA